MKQIIHEIQRLKRESTGRPEYYDDDVKKDIDELPDSHAKGYINYLRGRFIDEIWVDDSHISFYCNFSYRCKSCNWSERHGKCYEKNSLHSRITKQVSIIYQMGRENIGALLDI